MVWVRGWAGSALGWTLAALLLGSGVSLRADPSRLAGRGLRAQDPIPEGRDPIQEALRLGGFRSQDASLKERWRGLEASPGPLLAAWAGDPWSQPFRLQERIDSWFRADPEPEELFRLWGQAVGASPAEIPSGPLDLAGQGPRGEDLPLPWVYRPREGSPAWEELPARLRSNLVAWIEWDQAGSAIRLALEAIRLWESRLLKAKDPRDFSTPPEAEERELSRVGRGWDRARDWLRAQRALALGQEMRDLLAVWKARPKFRGATLEGPERSILLGGSQAEVLDLGFPLIFDFGGDDTYQEVGPQTTESPSARAGGVIFDYAGNDQYLSKSRRLGGGFFDVSLLWDQDGDDLYLAPSGSLGAGLFGVGILVDAAGRDRYRVPRWGQGASLFGAGFAYDRAGDDVWEAQSESQAYGEAAGFSLLYEGEGRDLYSLSQGAVDFRKDVLDSYGQGMSLGARNRDAGGVALLADGAGDDRYLAETWAQGVGYWLGLGILFDAEGSDSYQAGRYSQGCGVHQAAGVLFDAQGRDRYLAESVAQGVGYDESLGGLWDLAGDDQYLAEDMAQGVGFANGVGILFEAGGQDRYLARGSHSQGFGYNYRNYGSLGFLFDLRGVDRYLPEGRDQSLVVRKVGGLRLDTSRGPWGRAE